MTTDSGSPASAARPAATRWIIVALLFFAAVLNYVDKNTLSLLAPTIQKDLGLTDQDYANIQNAFQVAYTIALLASGVIVDRLGSRISLALFVGWWSLANVLTALARSATSLAGFRFALGLGEAGNWTASPKTVSEWFPARERGLAIGIYTCGTPIGMTLAPLFIIWLSTTYGWRSAFVITGVAGLVWLVPWLIFNRRTAADAALAAEGELNLAADGTPEKGWSWLAAFGQPVVWCLLLGRMFTDPIWFFYQNWFPKYLVTARGLTQADVKITWVLFLAAGLGSLVGGWLAGQLVKRGTAPFRARMYVMLGCACFMPLSPLVASVPTATMSLIIASLIAFAHLAWLTNISALVVDVVPKASLGSVFGIVAAGSSLGAIVMNSQVAKLLKPDAVTKLVHPDAYDRWYLVAAFFHLAVIPLIMWGVLRHQRARA
jgi:ACS family hexuronate transporter-like MFS transporter